ncbi:S-layer homology domain-containing protein [Pseudoflavonifractor sp. 524-17]|uniref:S-layer homology domain-containing protein n=1 Tax=Pseudoflavonifractor sp. 524-17 TaxID=2304577 RepID=UPI00137A9225|nr:S-layer homology domain-containing protein [Pseudoflavonifractor sp. 524-17]NCE66223.1 S-layer homology domain-containing protein [Pseudoflavonifractor sp. 524-17]
MMSKKGLDSLPIESDYDDFAVTVVEYRPLSSQPTAPTAGNFTDVKTSDYFAEPVAWAVEKKITAGTSATNFSPNATCTQGQILAFLWRAKGEPKTTGTVSGTQYYATAAQWAKEQGLTDKFSAEADCTRAMVVTYLWKLAGSPNAGTSDFTDVPANA